MSISTGERYQSLFEELNQHYFHGRLRNYRIEIVARDFVSDYLSPATVGLTQVRQKLIQLRKQSSLEMIATLLHEMAHAATPHTGYHHHSWKWRQEIERLRKLGAPIDEPPVLDLNRLTKSFVRHDACDVLWYNLAITPLHFARYFIQKHGCAPDVETLLAKCPWFLKVFSDTRLRARRHLARTGVRLLS